MNEPVIRQFREKGGKTTRKHPVILLTTTGAKTGKERVTPLNFSRDGDGSWSSRRRAARRSTRPGT